MRKQWVVLLIIAVIIQYFRNKQTSIVNYPDGNYDFIIVGGGTAGCLLAALLSEDKSIKILLLEAGQELGFTSNIPIAPTLLQRTESDWSFETTPQKYSSFGLNGRRQFLPRGKGLGGSGQLNYMLHGTGLPRDFDKWLSMGALGWDKETIKRLLRKLFIKKHPDNIFYKCYRFVAKIFGFDLNEYRKIYTTEIDDELLQITKSLKDAALEVANVTTQSFLSTIHNGLRTSTLNSFLHPVLQRPNLHVVLNSTVTKIIFRSNTAFGVEVQVNNKFRKVYSKNEVILSAGSIKTPQILLLSGIGPKEDLEKLNIPVVLSSPGVGNNLHDHFNTPIYISIEKHLSMTVDKVKKITSLYEYLMHGTGYLASPGVTLNMNVNNQTALFLFAMGSVDEEILRAIANTNQETFRAQFPFYYNTSQEGFLLLAHCMQPYSRGTIKLRNLDPNSHPLIDPNYLSDRRDVRCTIIGLRMMEQLVNTISLRLLKAKIHWPKIPKCASKFNDNNVTDDYLECIMRHGALTAHHAAGTCSMAGNNPVVDSNLNVIGVERLRVVDASIFPTPVSSPPNSIIIAMAYRAAQLIRDKYSLNIDE